MAVPLFIVNWIFPVIFVPYEFIKAVVRNVILRSDDEARQAAVLDQFQAGYNARMRVRKTALLTATMNHAVRRLNRPIRVLEVGSGSGANFGYYPPGTSVVCLDPNPAFEANLRRSAEKHPDVTLEAFHVGYGEHMKDVESGSVDVVVSTLTLCSVRDVDQCIGEIMRVLRPDGKFIFLEHVAAHRDNVCLYVMQVVMSLIWRYTFHGCCLLRRLDDVIRRAGFRHVDMDIFVANETLQPSPLFKGIALARTHISGVAAK